MTLKRDNRVELSTEPLEFANLFETFDVNLHYLGPHTRVKRRTAGIPSAIVGAINFNTNFTETISFNPGNKVFGIQKLATETSPNVFSDTSLPAVTDDTVFRVACESCSGDISTSYRLQLKLTRTAEKKAELEAFVSEISGMVQEQLTISVKSTKEASSFHSADILDTGVVDLVTIPLAVLPDLPPLNLTIRTQLVTSISVDMIATGPMESRINLQESGQFDVFHSRGSDDKMLVNATFTNWRFTKSNTTVLDTEDIVNVTATVTNKLRFIPTMSWSEKDVFWRFESPTIYSKSTHLHAFSSVDDQEICSFAVANSTGRIELEKLTVDVTAFNVPLCCGDIGLIKQLGNISDSTMNVTKICKAYCSGEETPEVYDSLEDACGDPGAQVIDKTSALKVLDELFGDVIIFPSDESTNSGWCGNVSTACPDCSVNDVTNICADRLVSSEMHTALTKLAKLVIAEWPSRKLMINEGWDEPTEQYPDRQHGNTSLYYEGRAAAIAVTQESDLGESDDEEINRRFYQLIKCAGLHIGHSQSDGYTEVCVGQPVNNFRRKRSLRSRRSTGSSLDVNCKNSIWPCLDLFQEILSDIAVDSTKLSSQLGNLDLFQSGTTEYPSERNVEDICGDIDETYSRDNMKQMKRLLQYPYDDFEFPSEGPSGQACGSITRRCVQDTSYSYSTDPLQWPSSRMMTPRLASRLHTFFLSLSETGVINPCVDSFNYCKGVCIPEDWSCAGNTRKKRQTENHQTRERGSRTKRSAATSELTLSKYQNNGRAIQVDLSDINVTMEYAASLAVLAGFDFVAIRESYLDLYVKNQAGIKASITPFPLVNLIDANHPTNSGEEYVLYDELLPLYDGHRAEQKLSDCYTITDIRNQGSQNRYFRIDSLLLQCLEEASYEHGSCIPVVKGSAYRTKSVNDINIDERHIEERNNFIRGKAVEIMPANTGDDPLYEVGLTVIRTCTAILRLKQMKIGIGSHSDRLYVDIRQSTGSRDLLTLWNVDNLQLYNKMKQVHDDLFLGGPIIRPTKIDKACKDPTLGKSLYYIRQPSSVLNICFNNNHGFCEDTKAAREKAVKVLLDNLVSVVGSGQLSESSIREQVLKCFVIYCGGCLGRGNIWIDKTKSCMSVVKTFLSALTLPFGGSLHDNAVFYNMDPRESNITSVACDGDNICLHDVQFYSVLMTTLQETYQPNLDNDVEEALYGPADNPLPVLDLLEQEMAMSASGVVKIYLESKDDLSALLPILKILMTYNRNVKEVEFHLTAGISHSWVISSLKNKILRWSTSVCPSLSRIVVTPYKLIDIPEDRRKRSTHKTQKTIRSKLRNDELAWLIRN
ncbi:Protein hedgehog [Mizuhopecten yessoensis]|uniref:Protein hedgehog n=2 Tax=Mizuhopecten yessoensis TaxID=6573 RepID=A0A210Q0J2_MIZYE|nr:Protein hedgehog [Mizuhopecten yessoensis]